MRHKAKEKFILFITIVLVSIYLIWRLFFTIPTDHGILSLVLGCLLFYCEFITALGSFDLMFKYLMYKGDIEAPPISDDEYPDVDVLVATHNEEVDLLYKTVNAICHMDYPDKNKVHIYICDDTNRKEVSELAAHFNIGYFGLEHNTEAKSGNYNNALKQTTSPLIATFDADMVPKSSFLIKTVPYFFIDRYKKENDVWRKLSEEESCQNKPVGFVQTPQGFYNHDLFQYNLYSETLIPNEQDFFSKELNILRNTTNSTVYTGSNTIISRRAVEEINYFPTGTITEDYETGLNIQAKGYQTFSTTEVMASGITPNTLKGMITQRIRWARGVIQSTKNCHIPFNKGLSISGNLSYFFGFSYWWSFFRRMVFLMAPILFALFDIQIVNTDLKSLLIFWLPSYIFNEISTSFLSSKLRNQRWNQIIDTIMAPFLIIPVFLETIGISQKKFKVTDKSKQVKRNDYRKFLYSIPNLILLFLSVAAMYRFTKGKYSSELLYSVVIIFWLFSNIINLVYAMFFLHGRQIIRAEDRVKAKETLLIHGISGHTFDLSDNGASFILESEHHEWTHTIQSLSIVTEDYSTCFDAEVLECYPLKNGTYKYRCKIEMISDEDKRQYFQIIHDREIEATDELDKWMNAIDGIILNAHKHLHALAQNPDQKRIKENS